MVGNLQYAEAWRTIGYPLLTIHTNSYKMTPPTIDRLSGLLEHFRVRARLSYSGTLCGLQRFDAASGHGYLHVLRRGCLEVSHPGEASLPARMVLSEPTLLFYPRPAHHWFHNPPLDGADFTCATVNFEGGPANPLARALPALIALPLARIDGLEAALALLFAETERARCGQPLLADRLFEVVLIQLLRWLLDHPQEAGIQTGMIMGLSDPRLARALVAMHRGPSEAWPVERMALCAGMSRTAFSNLFRQVLGQTPADYLTDWRIALAQAGLSGGRSIAVLAGELGYANASALSRVFAARTGHSPRAWLQQHGRRLAGAQPISAGYSASRQTRA